MQGERQISLYTSVDIGEMTVKEITSWLEQDGEPEPELLRRLLDDPRKTTTRLARRHIRRRERMEKERVRLSRLREPEAILHQRGLNTIAGVDQAGRTALAGPVLAAAVIMPREDLIPGLKASTGLTDTTRQRLYAQIRDRARATATYTVSPREIDRLGIVAAILRAVRGAVSSLELEPEHTFTALQNIPGLEPPFPRHRGSDRACYSTAAASIVAKVERDAIMDELDRRYPEYGFATNRGYATRQHRLAVEEHDYSPEHRRSFHFHDKNQLYLLPRAGAPGLKRAPAPSGDAGAGA